MKSTGIVRKIDDLGRVVIPKELRRTMNIDKKDPMEVFVEGNKIILSKYEPACIFCGEANNTIEFTGKTVCQNCVDKMSD
ncbi:MAG: AbrB/MazE/SpoVT family DNA-binding domain-containing protein [bacterium]